MGVVNVTPDSFSEGGPSCATEAAGARGGALLGQGAAIVDVGGESTLPQTSSRGIPLASPGAVVGVDTGWAEVAARALEAGARLVNGDVVDDVLRELRPRSDAAPEAGVPPGSLTVDPGLSSAEVASTLDAVRVTARRGAEAAVAAWRPLGGAPSVAVSPDSPSCG
ncbi:dihydropteroate synthase [Streptomyces akebiae]|uniref:Dihydropteroate synthase n=1 Tax=Streptomyces akebiae TaxID=2865673 RepID=A0ABX8XHE3_9ACTN|nr:dihydropteroate synthase [Streptomyces akebiae]QYX75361.1 dihydropteroate synthase [Streptomyces akebiae]